MLYFLFLHFRLIILSAGYFAGQFDVILDFLVVVEKVRSVELFLVFNFLFAVQVVGVFVVCLF